MTQLQMFRDNPFQIGSQNYRLLERYKKGPATNIEIVHQMHILNHTGRNFDLRSHGFDIEARPIKNGIWEFELK